MHNNPYLLQIEQTLPRILALVDKDRTSMSYGLADRYYWAWGLIDFGNGTFQGMAHGLSRLWVNKLWPYNTSKTDFIKRIDSIFIGTKSIIRKNGSLEEAFPNEGSYCVTALITFDLLCTMDLLSKEIHIKIYQKWQRIIQPMVEYLLKADEKHALISNHLATAVAALSRWYILTGDKNAEHKARILLDRIIKHQSDDGWFEEYGGPDPGYQTLCLYYLADVHKSQPEWGLLKPLKKSMKFLSHFAHPDGSFGGTYGSRCTRFYCPAGILALADQIPEAAALSDYMKSSINELKVVTLLAIDEPNLIPTFNAYCWAAVLQKSSETKTTEKNTLPAFLKKPFRKYYHDSGLIIDRGTQHYTIIATNKGGVVYHYKDGEKPFINVGVVVKNSKDRLGSNHSKGIVDFNIKGRMITIISPIIPMPKKLSKPYQFLVLRLLSITLFHSSTFREWIKRLIVKYLISYDRHWPLSNQRRIFFGERLEIQDELEYESGYKLVEDVNDFVPIHMASQGYWQIQDEGVIL